MQREVVGLTPYIDLPRVACIAEVRELDATGIDAAGFEDVSLRCSHYLFSFLLLFLFLLWIGQTLVRLNALYRNILLFWELVVS